MLANNARHFAAFGRSDAHCVSRACAYSYELQQD